jgi:peptidoglycan/LPS O-acetylase OafA/YrhL
VLGILLARWQTLQRENGSRAQVRPWQANLVLGLSFCGIMVSVLLLFRFNLRDFYDDGMLAPILGGIVWAVSAAPTGMSRLLGSRWLVALGNGSYALYLINIPMLFVFQAMHWTAQALYPVYLALCVGLSVLSFHYFETPVRLWLVERFRLRPRMSKVAAEGWSLT